LENFAAEEALAIAVRVEYRLAVLWETEQEEMRGRYDKHTVIEISVEEMAEASKAFDNVPPGRSDIPAEQYVIDLLTRFPADQAWWTAHRVKKEIEAWCRWKAPAHQSG
jgi:hypothetical protein